MDLQYIDNFYWRQIVINSQWNLWADDIFELMKFDFYRWIIIKIQNVYKYIHLDES